MTVFSAPPGRRSRRLISRRASSNGQALELALAATCSGEKASEVIGGRLLLFARIDVWQLLPVGSNFRGAHRRWRGGERQRTSRTRAANAAMASAAVARASSYVRPDRT